MSRRQHPSQRSPSPYARLSRRRQSFVDHYVDCGVGTKAIEKAGFTGSRPDVAAAKFRADPDVKAAIAERSAEAIAKSGVRVVRVLQELAAIAFFNRNRLRDAAGKLLPLHTLPDEVTAAIVSEEFDDLGNLVKYRLASKTEALGMLTRYLALAAPHEDLPGSPAPRDVSPLDTARRIAFILADALRSAAAAPESGTAGSPPST